MPHAHPRLATADGDGLEEWVTRALPQRFLSFMTAFVWKGEVQGNPVAKNSRETCKGNQLYSDPFLQRER